MGCCERCGKDIPSIIVRRLKSGRVVVSSLCNECFEKEYNCKC